MRVLVTGAGGYVGSRLVPVLLARGHQVVASFSRDGDRPGLWWLGEVERRVMDVHDERQVRRGLRDVDAVVYLVHGLAGPDFADTDRLAAGNVAAGARAAGVERIVFLSGLVPDVPEHRLSPHLASRLEVERILASTGVPTVTARAAIVIGSGSTSFEILRHLSERLPLQAVPGWLGSRVQPIAVVDVLEVLAACLDLPAGTRTFDVGGPDRLTYARLLRVYADVARIVRPQLPVPFLPTQVAGALAGRMTDVPSATVGALVQSLQHDMVCRDDAGASPPQAGQALLGVRPAIERALTRPRAGTRPRDRDPMGALPGDPSWAGGGVYLFDGRVRRRPSGAVNRLLLGPRRPW